MHSSGGGGAGVSCAVTSVAFSDARDVDTYAVMFVRAIYEMKKSELARSGFLNRADRRVWNQVYMHKVFYT